MHCDGFRVERGRRRFGVVERVDLDATSAGEHRLVIRGGLLGNRLLVTRTADVARIVPHTQRLRLLSNAPLLPATSPVARPVSNTASPSRRLRLRATAAGLLGAIAICAVLAATVVGAASATSSRQTLIPGVVDVNTNLAFEGARAAGTGIVLSRSGEILTNNHVIEGSTSVKVTDVDNGKTYTGTVVGYDIRADVAVVQLSNAAGLQIAPLGNSTQVKVGEKIVTIGNAGGTGGTPSTSGGTITALDQSIVAMDEMSASQEQLSDMIETNATLEPGDSGGPMINSHGQVVGIDTAGGGPQGFSFQSQQPDEGFAIPIDTATRIAAAIESGRSSSAIHVGATPFLGVDVEQIDASAEFQTVPGLLVAGVVAGKPAAKAGITPYDIITTLDRHPVTTGSALTSLLLAQKPGDTIRLGWDDPTGQSHISRIRLVSGPPQ